MKYSVVLNYRRGAFGSPKKSENGPKTPCRLARNTRICGGSTATRKITCVRGERHCGW